MNFPTLYKRSVTGKVSTWYVEIDKNAFRTVSGFLDGQKVTSEWTVCEPKNIGKKNATTAEQQAVAEAKAMFDKRKALGYFENVEDIDTPVYFKPMLAHDYNDYKGKISFPFYSQPKLDGVRCIIRSDGMWSRNGKPIISAPHIFEALKPLFEANPDLILDGELYAEREIADFNTIISCVRKTKPTVEDLEISKKFIRYHIYDIPSMDYIYSERLNNLIELSKTSLFPQYCFLVDTIIVNSEYELKSLYNVYMSQGYEGQILRINGKYENKRSKFLLKHKSFVDADFIIKGVIEGKGNLSGKVGKLRFEMPDGKSFDAAVNGTWEYLEQLWNSYDLIGKKATVKYFELTEDGVPRFPKVVEIRDYE